MSDESASVVAAGFVQLFGSQLITRLLTFGLNLATARSLSPAAYGIGAVQFHLINTTILFLSREGFRRGCLRVDPSHPGATQKVLGTALLTIPIGAFLSILVTAAVLFTTKSDDQWFRWAVGMQGIAAFLEICAEPLYILATVRLWFGVRVGCEAAATIAKNVVTLVLLLHRGTPPALAFSWGQIAYAAAIFGGFASYFAFMAPSVKPRDEKTPPPLEVDKDILRISGTFSLQAGGKLLLAEGSKAVLATATPLQEQGVYGLVNNLGSLVVRTLFQPYEEVAFVAFSRPPQGNKSSAAAAKERATLLSTLCRGISLLGGVAAAFGPAYSYVVLFLLYGRRWADSGAAAALALYSWYVALLAVNGTLEAFVHAVADQRGLHRANIALVVLSVIHMTLSVGAVKTAGAAGLLVADAVNMVLRVGYCLSFAATFFREIGGLGAVTLIPRRGTRAALFAAFIITFASQALFMPETSPIVGLLWQEISPLAKVSFAVRGLAHVAVGVVCLAGVMFTAYVNERDVVTQLRRFRKKAD